ncbi:hypothetical protein F5X97DRAFT_315654 [Nemania serpens]|nr:hypothetical protein F5X97DRAFT_315654 [Nemania serpens]
MPAAAFTTLLARACLALAIAALVSPAMAQVASVDPQDLAAYFTRWKMALALETAENAPIGSQFDVIPLTTEAGLQQTDLSQIPAIHTNLVALDYSNFTKVPYVDKVVFFSCDSSTTLSKNNDLTPDRMLNIIMNNAAPPAAILLYSTTKPICFLGGPNLPYTRVWTMASQDDALKVRNVLSTTTTEPVVASITISAKAVESEQPNRPGNTSAIAMSILYSITGLITLLFLLIIATGAVRAHRNPERYGPRASVNGRPRRSRARGIAIAMLETLPIVKFSESDQRKPDEETALENTRGIQPLPQDASQVVTGNAPPRNGAAPEASSETADNTVSRRESESAPVSVGATTTPDKTKEEPRSEEDHPSCSICTEDFTVGEDVRVLPCNHKFHPACVDPWLVNVSGTCPLCRLDLRPAEDVEQEETEEAAAPPDTASPADGHLAPPPAETDQPAAGEATNRRRRSRLLDWNRLRNASVDERLQALRQYRQSQQSSDLTSSTADDERRHSRLTGRLRERLHIRGDSRNNASASAPAPAPTPRSSLPPASTRQH